MASNAPAYNLQRIPSAIDAFDSQDLGRTGLNAFFNISARWGLTSADQRTLLGSPPRSTFYNWKKTRQAHFGQDTLERISYVLGIYKALHILLPDTEAADGWVKRANDAPLFNGQSALDYMRGGRVVDLADVRRYLDTERGL